MEDLMKKAQEEHDIASQQYMELDEHDSQRKAQKDRIDELTMTMNVIAEFMAGDSYGCRLSIVDDGNITVVHDGGRDWYITFLQDLTYHDWIINERLVGQLKASKSCHWVKPVVSVLSPMKWTQLSYSLLVVITLTQNVFFIGLSERPLVRCVVLI
ncbi:hypothetical protein N7470_001537 [Penicillium chermesinum]|nr:hypothetical protein N7470_001537 [Penicillium chermesinum]